MDMKTKFHTISSKRKIYFNDVLEKADINMMQLEILAYLNDYPESNTFTEIMKSKDYAKSHVSTAITHLVEKKYLLKEAVKSNKKIFNLKLTPQTQDVIEEYNKAIEYFRKDAFDGVSQEQMDIFEQVLDKMLKNLGE